MRRLLRRVQEEFQFPSSGICFLNSSQEMTVLSETTSMFQFPSSGICFLNSIEGACVGLGSAWFQFPSSGICFLNNMSQQQFTMLTSNVSIPFKRDMLSEHKNLSRLIRCLHQQVSIPFKRDMLSERIDEEAAEKEKAVSIPFKRDMLSELNQH